MPDWLRHPLKDPFYKDWDVCPYCGIGVRRRVISEDGDVEEYSYRYCPWCGEKIYSEKETDMDAKRCDCCGKYYSEFVEYRFFMVPRSCNPTMSLDFCKECQKKLDAFPAYYVSVKDGKKKEETDE